MSIDKFKFKFKFNLEMMGMMSMLLGVWLLATPVAAAIQFSPIPLYVICYPTLLAPCTPSSSRGTGHSVCTKVQIFRATYALPLDHWIVVRGRPSSRV
jgi:hypothetical protein